MEKLGPHWIWFFLAVAALAAAVVAQGLAAAFYVAAVVFLGAGIWFLIRRR